MSAAFQRNLIILIVTTFWWSYLTAQNLNPTNPELARLRSQYDKAASAALAPIQKRYTEELQILQIKLTKSGDLDGALTVKNELAGLTSAAKNSKFDLAKTLENTQWAWRSDHPEETIAFQGNQVFVYARPSKTKIEGKFTIRKSRVIELTLDGSTLIIEFDSKVEEYASEVTSGPLAGRKFQGKRIK